MAEEKNIPGVATEKESDEVLEEIRTQTKEVLKELLAVAKMKPGQILVVGCSSSEIGSYKIGSHSSETIGQTVYKALYEELKPLGIYLAAQCCEHLNRSLILEEEAAEKYGYEKLHFYQGDIASYTGRDEVDMVVTLHACDTATDYALEKAVKWNAKVILSVPCCQHELNRQIANKELYPIMDYGILKERMAALLTDGIRAKLLENAGYETQILEFIDMEHTPKNLLIRAVKRQEGSKKLPEELKACMEAYHVKPTLADLLTEKEEP